MAASDVFSVKFWGVRGSIPCSDPGVSRYGGNTSCLEIRCGEHLIVLDGGTGVRYLGRSLDQSAPLDADVFLTHTHFDHVCGLPFFSPFYNPRNTFRIWAGHLSPDLTLERVLIDMMMAPLFPVPLTIFAANMSYRDFRAGESVDVKPGVTARTTELNHPNRATGYRIDYKGKSFCYLTDTEHTKDRLDRNVLELVEGADSKAAADLIATSSLIGRSLVLPPGAPKELAEPLREAFWKAVNDPAFMADAKKTKLPLSQLKGAEIQATAERILGMSPDTAAKARKAIFGG